MKKTKVNFGRKCILCGKREDAFKFALLLTLSLVLSLSLSFWAYLYASRIIINDPHNAHAN